MRSTSIFVLTVALAASTAGGCGDDGKDKPDAGPGVPDPICLEPGPGPYSLSFTDVTEEVGLGQSGLVMTGGTVTVGDVDGDHWPDLVVTKNSNAREDPSAPTGLYRLLRNTGSGFEDWTWSSGLFRDRDGEQGRATTYVVFGDVDNDGDADAFSVVYEDTGSGLIDDDTAVFFNDGSGKFTIGPEQVFTEGIVDPATAAAFLDYDRDGVLDVYVGHHYGTYGLLSSTLQDQLFAGDGQGSFDDVTAAAGLTTVAWSEEDAPDGATHKPTWGVTACDVDGDGWTDLMTTSYGRQLNNFYRNLGDGTFEDLTLTSGFGSDDNEDYSDNQFFLCYCQDHPDEPECVDADSPMIVCDTYSWSAGMDDQPWRLGGNSSNTVCGDVDNDGDMDLLAVELAHWHIGGSSDKTELLINDGFPANPFVRPGNETTGLTRTHVMSWNEGDLGGALADFDNDGRIDVLVASSDYPGTWSLLWQQQADGTFVGVEDEAGAKVHRAHGIGLIDYDRDGDYDLVLGTSLMRWAASDSPPAPDDAYAYLLRNDGGQDANKMILHVRGSGAAGGANRDAVGARVRVTAGGATYTREIQGGYGLNRGQQDQLLIIGIGEACTADEVTVSWPDGAGTSSTFNDVMANHVAFITQGEDAITYQALADYTAAQ